MAARASAPAPRPCSTTGTAGRPPTAPARTTIRPAERDARSTRTTASFHRRGTARNAATAPARARTRARDLPLGSDPALPVALPHFGTASPPPPTALLPPSRPVAADGRRLPR